MPSEQPLSIDNGDKAPFGRNETRSFEGSHGDRHTGPPHSEHHGEELVCQRQFSAVSAIINHQQPTSETLRDRAASTGEICACRLDVEGVRIVQKGMT